MVKIIFIDLTEYWCDTEMQIQKYISFAWANPKDQNMVQPSPQLKIESNMHFLHAQSFIVYIADHIKNVLNSFFNLEERHLFVFISSKTVFCGFNV